MKKNLVLLFLIQISNYVFPLISMPYLIRILGVTSFGIIAIFIAIVQYVNIITDFGFSFTSTRKITKNKDNKDEVAFIFSLTIYAKIILLLICVFAFGAYIFINAKNEYYIYYILGVIYCFFSIFESVWLFQGMDRLNVIANITLVSKTIAFLLIFCLVNTSDDTFYAILCTLVGAIFSGSAALISIYKLKISFLKKVHFIDVWIGIKDSFDIFIANVTISFYTTLNTIVLGAVYGPTIVGYFSAADKIRLAAQGLLSPIQQLLFPRVTDLLNQGNSFSFVLKNYGFKVIGFGLFVSIMLLIMGYPFSLIYFGENFDLTGKILLVLAPIPFIVSIGIVFGQWSLIGTGKDKILRNTYIFFSFVHLLLLFPYIYYFNNYGVAISILTTEFLISCTFIYIYLNSIKLEKKP